MLTKLDAFIEKAKSGKIKRLAVASASDEPVLEAVMMATKAGIIEPILTGDKQKIEQIAEKIGFTIQGIEVINEKDPYKSAVKAVELIKQGKAEILMKGLIATGPLLKAVLDKEKGLRKGGLLSHIALYETPFYHKLIGVTDAAMNVAPTFEEKVEILLNAVDMYHKLGVENPKVAVIGAVETVNPKMEATVHAAMLTMMNRRNQIRCCLVDGPLAIDNAVSKDAAEHKGIISDVAGDADILITPDINSGNVLYKSLGFLGGGVSAAVLMGAAVPVVLTSRSDTEKSKMLSIALAAAME